MRCRWPQNNRPCNVPVKFSDLGINHLSYKLWCYLIEFSLAPATIHVHSLDYIFTSEHIKNLAQSGRKRTRGPGVTCHIPSGPECRTDTTDMAGTHSIHQMSQIWSFMIYTLPRVQKVFDQIQLSGYKE